MKSIKLFFSVALLAIGTSLFAQSVIIDENFQTWKEQGWKNDTICNYKKADSKANFKVVQAYGDNKVEYKLIRCAVAPTCEAKKSPAKTGVTAGYVEVSKKEGEFVIGEQKFISTIEVGASATGDVRGYALMKSIAGGEWVKVGEYIGSKGEGSDAQSGFVSKITINESDVSLKFVPTMCGKDEPALQTFRIHNIKVFGK